MSNSMASPASGRVAASVLTLAALLAASPAHAQDDGATIVADASSMLGRVAAVAPVTGPAPAVRTEVARALVPSDASGEPAGTARTGSTSERVTVSRWTRGSRASVGMGVGTVGWREPGSDALLHPTPVVTVGVRLAVADRTTMYADASGAGGVEAPRYQGRVGMEFKSASAARGLGFDRGAIGMQLDSGYRLQMRPRKGGLAIYLRGQF